jgi:hypothetical protein
VSPVDDEVAFCESESSLRIFTNKPEEITDRFNLKISTSKIKNDVKYKVTVKNRITVQVSTFI